MPSRQARRFLKPPHWTDEQIEVDRLRAIELFRQQRMREPLQQYLHAFGEVESSIRTVLDGSRDLASLEDFVTSIVSEQRLAESFRYLTAPPISLDDLKTLTQAPSISSQAIRRDPTLTSRLIATIRAGLDPKRFPWVESGRSPTTEEREAAVLASAALIASQRVATARRMQGKEKQERQVREELTQAKFIVTPNPKHAIATLGQAPKPGHFIPTEVIFGDRKTDLLLTAWDGRVMPIECKVSNSALNSVKRLNNDAAAKAVEWLRDFGATQVVPVAVLSGVFNMRHLLHAQERGLTIIWSHRLTDLTDWVASTKAG